MPANKKKYLFIIKTFIIVLLIVGMFFSFQNCSNHEVEFENAANLLDANDLNSNSSDIDDSNEFSKISSSQSKIKSPFGFCQGALKVDGIKTNYDPSYKYLNELNVFWDRPFEGHVWTNWDDIETKSTGKGNYDFSKADKIINKVFKKNPNMNLFISLPIVNRLYGSPEDINKRFYPTDLDAITAFKKFVKTLVKRYPKIKYWMVGQNEFDDPSGYASDTFRAYSNEGIDLMSQYTKAGCEAIEEVCSDCHTVLGGAVLYNSFSKKGDVISTPDNSELTVKSNGVFYNLLSTLGKSCSNLIIDYHFWPNPDYKDYKNQRIFIDNIKKIRPEARIWTTESGIAGDDNKSSSLTKTETNFEISEKTQADNIVRTYLYSLAYGQEKIFWTNTVEYNWTDDDSSIFDHTGLIHNSTNTDGKSHKKLSFYTFKKMVEILDGSDWKNIKILREKNDVYVYKLTKNKKPIWVMWNDGSDSQKYTLKGLSTNQIKVTKSVPSYNSGLEIQNKNLSNKDVFDIMIWDVSKGTVILSVDKTPIFVELVEL